MLVTSYPHRCHGAHAFFYESLFISRVCDDVRAMPGLEEMEMRGRGGGVGERDVTVTGEEQNLGEGAESIWKRCDKGGGRDWLGGESQTRRFGAAVWNEMFFSALIVGALGEPVPL